MEDITKFAFQKSPPKEFDEFRAYDPFGLLLFKSQSWDETVKYWLNSASHASGLPFLYGVSLG